MDASNENSLEADAFLQLIASFGIASGFNDEELSRLIPVVSPRRQSVNLCHYLGYTYLSYSQIKIFVYNICTVN